MAAVTQLCAMEDVETIWSDAGVDARLEDDPTSTTIPAGLEDNCLDLVSTKIQALLCPRYGLINITTNCDWVRWCAATLVAEFIAYRRGNPVPESIRAAAKEYRDALTAIFENRLDLLDNAGDPVALRTLDGAASDLPFVSNLSIDGRYNRAKIRRVESTSTQLPAAGKSHPLTEYYQGLY